MEIRFKDRKGYDVACRYLSGNNYKFVSYKEDMAIRFFHIQPFNDAVKAISEHECEFSIHEAHNMLTPLTKGYSCYE